MDVTLLNGIQEYLRSPFLDFVMPLVTHLGDLALIWFIAAAVLIAQPAYRRGGIAVVLAVLIAAALGTFLLKPLFDRTRPYEALQFFGLLIPAPLGSSFPSNHSLVSFAAATALCCLPGRGGALLAVKIGAVVIACLIAFSRVYLYVHYPSDIAVGAVLGIALGFLAVCIAKQLPPLPGEPSR